MADYLRAEEVGLVVDATHPFAARISANAAEACARAEVPRLVLDRPAWEAGPGDDWHTVPDAAAAAGMVSRLGRRVFLTVGAGEIEAFAPCRDTWFLVRLVDMPRGPLPLAACAVIAARGPFAAEAERELMQRHEIDLLACKASGGEMTAGKLTAARALGLPVVMIERPRPPAGPRVETPDGAVAWIADLLA